MADMKQQIKVSGHIEYLASFKLNTPNELLLNHV
jgi:hypothetical protein